MEINKLTVLFIALLNVFFFAMIYQTMGMKTHFTGMTTRLDAFYFSMTTFATVGYGDIIPKSQTAKTIVMLQQFSTIVMTMAIVTDIVTEKKFMKKERKKEGEI